MIDVAPKLSDAEARQRMQARGFHPDDNAPYVNVSTKWPGVWADCGHSGEPTLNNVTNPKTVKGCLACRNKVGARRRLPDSEARRQMIECGFQPDADAPYTDAHTAWSGVWADCGHRAAPTRATVVNKGSRCAECSKGIRGDKKRCITDADAREEALSYGFRPDSDSVFVRVAEPWPGVWTGCGHRASPRLNLLRGGSRCQQCYFATAKDRLRRSQEEALALAAERGFVPLAPYQGSDYPWPGLWTECGHQTSPTFYSLKTGVRCQVCWYANGIGSAKRFPDEVARAQAEACGFRPDEDIPYPNSLLPWPGTWIECGHRGEPALGSIKPSPSSPGSRCTSCATTGYDPNKLSFMYLMVRPGEQQFGITNNLPRRLRVHGYEGWVLIDSVEGDGRAIQREETRIKRWLRPITLPGTTENWSTADLEVETLAELHRLSNATETAADLGVSQTPQFVHAV